MLVFVDEAAEDGPALDPFMGEAGDGVVGPGRAELKAAMRSCTARILDWVVDLHRRRQAGRGDGWLPRVLLEIVNVLTCRILGLLVVGCHEGGRPLDGLFRA